jgi:hypothetical protein
MEKAAALVERYGREAKEALSGPGDPEAALSQPVTELVRHYGDEVLGLRTYLHAEVREDEGSVRPDFGLKVNGLMTGHVELKRPGTSLDPSGYGKTSHNGEQWRRLQNLPNLLHTDGRVWRLWRYGELIGEEVTLHTPSLTETKGALTAPPSFYAMLNNFITWKPTPITTVSRLINVMAPLAAMLREDVIQSLKADRRYAKKHSIDENLRPFIGLKRDWRATLHPRATNEEFADGFAQTVIFSMIIALSDGIDLDGKQIPDIAQSLQDKHTLLGMSLNLLTQHLRESSVGLATETIVRALSATDWERISAGRKDLYLYLYEDFLEKYNPEKRKKSGSYYTPIEVVDGMTKLSDEALRKFLNVSEGLSSDQIAVVDPAMGTGTYPLSVLRHIAHDAESYGAGAVADAITSAAQRLYGIEQQSGPYSVAELRLSQAVREMGGELPENGLNLYVADTLEDPKSGTDRQLSYTLQLIAEQRQQANKMKLETPIQVCIGNPPYGKDAKGLGGWVENGDGSSKRTLLDDFKNPDGPNLGYVLNNLYVFFWRWAMWKVFESTPSSTGGVVCFITATGYLKGEGFAGMREWIRRNTSKGWIINLTPEGLRPPKGTEVFDIDTPVAIGLFLRNEQNNTEEAAEILYTEIHGTTKQKYKQLSKLSLTDKSFVKTGTRWKDAFVSAASEEWSEMPALNDLFPWTASGIKPNKTWVYAPTPDLLEQRWFDLLSESDIEVKRKKFKETGSTKLEKKAQPLPGDDVEKNTGIPIRDVSWTSKPSIVRIGYRTFDRQYIIADKRLLERARPELWAARIPGQLFLNELHANMLRPGPGTTFSALIPDTDFFKGSESGRALPLYHPDGTPNVAPGLLEQLSHCIGQEVSVEDLAAYVAGVTAHPHYVERFSKMLKNFPNRVPMTSNSELWQKAVELGREVIWLHTYGERGASRDGLTSIMEQTNNVALPEYSKPVGSDMPEKVEYNEEERTLKLGAGVWTDVGPRTRNYTISGTNAIDLWVGYRKKEPNGRVSSPLDYIILTSWTTQLSREFHELLVVLTRLVAIEDEQAQLLDDIMESDLLSYDMLQEYGVKFPQDYKNSPDRKPRMIAEGQGTYF